MVQSDPSYSAILLDWDLEQEHQFDERAALKIIRAVRRRNKKVPIFLIADRTLVSELPLEVIKQVHEYIHLFGDTPAFIANRVDFAVDRYDEQLAAALLPGAQEVHRSGRLFVGRAGTHGRRGFSEASGGYAVPYASSARICCAPTWASPPHRLVPGLTISVLRQSRSGMRRASSARTGPSTFWVVPPLRTRLLATAIIGNNDMVLIDANCHKSICHSLTVTGGRPVYFKPTRNGYGMIGLVPLRRFSPDYIKQLIANSPFSAKATSQEPTYAVVTNSTYDGFCYDVQRVTSELARSVPRLHFDEAWYAYAKFHAIYRGRFAMDVPEDMPNRPLLFAVQSTHKMLAAFLHGVDDPRQAESTALRSISTSSTSRS